MLNLFIELPSFGFLFASLCCQYFLLFLEQRIKLVFVELLHASLGR